MTEYTATNIKHFEISKDVFLAHEIWDTEEGFMHRATMAVKHGDWVGYEHIAYVKSAMGTFCCTMDCWQPMFPEAFQLTELKPV